MSFQVMWPAALLSIAVAIAFFIIYARDAKKYAKDPAWNDLERRFSCDKDAMQGGAFRECFFSIVGRRTFVIVILMACL